MVGKSCCEPGQTSIELADGENPCGQSGKTGVSSDEALPGHVPRLDELDNA